MLEISDLKVWFPIKSGVLQRTVGHVRAVDGVSLSLSPGETLALVGESGCGKSTVGRAIVRMLNPTHGKIRWKGRDVEEMNEDELRDYRRSVQMVFQDSSSSLNPRMRVREILSEGIVGYGILKESGAIEAKLLDILEQVSLPVDSLDRYPHEFSGGQRQRLGIARALCVDPEIIVLDESIAALDVSIQAQILNLLDDLQKKYGVGYLFITHDLSVVRFAADRVAVMYLGQLVEGGSAEQVDANPLHPYTKGLLAASPSYSLELAEERELMKGEIPSATVEVPGCRFAQRCQQVVDNCRIEQPQLALLKVSEQETRLVRCPRVVF